MTLTPRQLEIAACVAKGMPASAIADQLGVSVRTVEFHIERAADRIPGDARPRHRLAIWFLSLRESGPGSL